MWRKLFSGDDDDDAALTLVSNSHTVYTHKYGDTKDIVMLCKLSCDFMEYSAYGIECYIS